MTSQPSLNGRGPNCCGPGSTIRNEADLAELWAGLMATDSPGSASASTLWLVFLDPDGVVLPTLVPIDGLPERPEPGAAAGLRHVIATQIDHGLAGSVAMLLGRAGPSAMAERDRAWARALREGVGSELVPWPIFFAAGDELRVFAPDDLIAG